MSEADVATLLSVASPDLPLVPWITMTQLNAEDYRSCPKVYNESSLAVDGYDCIDSSGINWSGNASFTSNGSTATITMSNFGPSGIEGGWLGTGTVDIALTNSGGYLIKTRMKVDSWDGDPQVWWVDTEMGLGVANTLLYAEHYNGTIGLQDWGLATVSGRNVFLAQLHGCDYADHGLGSMSIGGKNEALYSFEEVLGGPPAPPAQDTGFADTGDTGTRDTGDTGDTGGGSTGDPLPDLFPGGGGACGVCTVVTIDGVATPDCVSPARSMSFPFPLLD